MRIQKIFIIAVSLLVGSLVQAAEDYEEMSYNDLVNQLSQKKTTIQENHVADVEKNYQFRVGFTNSFARVSANGSRHDISQGGVMLGISSDLEQKKWYAEGLFKNFSSAEHPGVSTNFRELEARLGLQTILNQKYGIKAFSGANLRFLETTDTQSKKSDNSMSPVLTVGLSGDVLMNSLFALGTEALYRSPLATSSDLGSWDFSVYSSIKF